MYLDKKGIMEVYEASLKSDAVDIVCMSHNYQAVLGDYFDNTYAPRLYDNCRQTREILPQKDLKNASPESDRKKHQVRYVTTNETSESDMMIFDNKVVLISFSHESPFAIVISDKEIVNGFKVRFAALWKACEVE